MTTATLDPLQTNDAIQSLGTIAILDERGYLGCSFNIQVQQLSLFE